MRKCLRTVVCSLLSVQMAFAAPPGETSPASELADQSSPELSQELDALSAASMPAAVIIEVTPLLEDQQQLPFEIEKTPPVPSATGPLTLSGIPKTSSSLVTFSLMNATLSKDLESGSSGNNMVVGATHMSPTEVAKLDKYLKRSGAQVSNPAPIESIGKEHQNFDGSVEVLVVELPKGIAARAIAVLYYLKHERVNEYRSNPIAPVTFLILWGTAVVTRYQATLEQHFVQRWSSILLISYVAWKFDFHKKEWGNFLEKMQNKIFQKKIEVPIVESGDQRIEVKIPEQASTLKRFAVNEALVTALTLAYNGLSFTPTPTLEKVIPFLLTNIATGVCIGAVVFLTREPSYRAGLLREAAIVEKKLELGQQDEEGSIDVKENHAVVAYDLLSLVALGLSGLIDPRHLVFLTDHGRSWGYLALDAAAFGLINVYFERLTRALNDGKTAAFTYRWIRKALVEWPGAAGRTILIRQSLRTTINRFRQRDRQDNTPPMAPAVVPIDPSAFSGVGNRCAESIQ